jgi:hypothetical protein
MTPTPTARARTGRSPAKAAPVLVATEHQEQSLLFQWAAVAVTRYPELRWLAAVPNGGHRAISVAKRLKAEGVKPGYPDVLLDVARGGYHGLRVELKRTKGGAVSGEQRDWHNWLWEQGYCISVCKGWEEARDVIVKYLTLESA